MSSQMSERLLQLDDVREINSPGKVARLFSKLGYDASAQPFDIQDLDLSERNNQGISEAHLIANVGNSELYFYYLNSIMINGFVLL